MKVIRHLLKIVLTATLIASVVCYGLTWLEKYLSNQDYDAARQIATGSTGNPAHETAEEPVSSDEADTVAANPAESDPYIQQLMSIDLAALQAVNPEVIGWVFIPDTAIDYPVLQHSDNDYYLNHSWDNSANGAGAIFMDSQNSTDLSDFNTIIYGHNMVHNAMFGSLHRFTVLQYVQEHPSIYLLTEDGIFRYDIFAAHRVNKETIMFGMQIQTDAMREEFISFALDYSVPDTGLIPTVDDSILTLSTCAGNSRIRMLVQGILVPEGSVIWEK